MAVRMLTSIAGPGLALGYGEVAHLDAETERRLIDSGQAEPVPVPEKKPEVRNAGKPANKAVKRVR